MNSLLARRIAAARAALLAHGSGESGDGALVLPREPGPPVAFFVSLTPRMLKPRLDVEVECELLVYPVIAGRSSIGCQGSHPDVLFRGITMRSRFQGSGLEGHQWLVDADADAVVLTREDSTNGTRLIRDDETALARALERPYRYGAMHREGIGTALGTQRYCFLPLRDGDVLLTVYEAWLFAML